VIAGSRLAVSVLCPPVERLVTCGLCCLGVLEILASTQAVAC
jgi:hypothetical protein